MSRQGGLEDNRGFTLVEVMVTIIIMGIVFAIASASWFGVVESRRVDSAANQVVADLRLAHTQATNRLTNSSFVVSEDDTSTYQMGPDADLETRTLPGDDEGTPETKILTATDINIVFKPDGSADIDPAGEITVASTDGNPFHTIEINPVTSRVNIVN